MKRIIPILLLVLAHSVNAQVGSLGDFKQENQFRFFVEMEVRDFMYELDSEYSLLLWTFERLKKNSFSEEEKKKIDVSISRTEKVLGWWTAEVEKMEEMKKSHPHLKVVKFVLDLPENQESTLEKQGYLVVSKNEILEMIWDDGIAFYDGILGLNHAAENLEANQSE